MEILILRDPRESKAKCSLTPLEGMPGVRFVLYHPDRRLRCTGQVLLDPEGELLTPADHGSGLLLIDCAWRRVPKLARTLDGPLVRRRLQPLLTAYPRQSKTFDDPDEGLASVEALFAATAILGEPRLELLDGYRWREEFLARNGLLNGTG